MTSTHAEPGRLAMPRRRGAVSGLLIFVLGAWCAAVPFVGPLFDLTIGPDNAFDMTAGRFWLSLLPGVVAALGGLMLIRSANRASATLGAQLAMAGGIWLVVGPTVSMLWNDGAMQSGQPAGGTTRQVLELLLYFYGTGAAITALAGIAFGRVTARHAGDLERLTAAAARDRDRDGVPDDRERPAAVATGRPDRDADGIPDDREGAGRFERGERDEPVTPAPGRTAR
jgi:hypothetical protein